MKSRWPRTGPSPRARGSLRGKNRLRVGKRSIPACAGLTGRSGGPGRATPVHPRVRGAHQRHPRGEPGRGGPSPRARGSLSGLSHARGWSRSIPACAGLTGQGFWVSRSCSVHPRVRGAHRGSLLLPQPGTGPSPRARGSPHDAFAWRIPHRSIPACAGLTEPPTPTRWTRPVHPRVRGAHRPLWVPIPAPGGPSPRARGSPHDAFAWRIPHRSIPACAGLTTSAVSAGTVSAVHPRVRGAHPRDATAEPDAPGPSPRARGSRSPGRRGGGGRRSIPACAGLTPRATSSWRAPSVHPRVRGAHTSACRTDDMGVGPSPRARGSPDRERLSRTRPRSIPACAGLTASARRRGRSWAVHPRVRGAHDAPMTENDTAAGPSPRARGSPTIPRAGGDGWRSIPACAGLTFRDQGRGVPYAVHPRVRGAHPWRRRDVRVVNGPSPRARGSPSRGPDP